MKRPVIITCLFVFAASILFASVPYCVGDTLNCLALNGLKLRDAPKGDPLATVKLGDQVVVVEKIYQPDTYENIHGRWVKVRFKQMEGFVFDGYLSFLPAPSFQDSSLREYVIRVAQKVGKPMDKTNECDGEGVGESSYHVTIQQYQGKNLLAQITDYGGWEWGHTTITFEYATLEEILLICRVVFRFENKEFQIPDDPENREVKIRFDAENGTYDKLTVKMENNLDWRVIVTEESGY